MIDLHCHLLPGVDDGARDMDDAVAMARAAVEGGVDAIVATPHVSASYPNDPRGFADQVARVQAALDAARVPLRVHTGAEVAWSMVPDLGDERLRAALIAGTHYLLLEPPHAGPAPFLDRLVHDLIERGFGIVIAHPERIQTFHSNVGLLEKLVDEGALCSITAGSVTGRWGRVVKKFSEELFRRGLVHNLASDAHDAGARSPALAPQMDEVVAALPELEGAIAWLTDDVPRAIIAGEAVDAEPPRIERGGGLLARLRRR